VASPRALRLLEGVWNRFTAPLIRRNADLAGRLTYAADAVLRAFLSEGNSFEMMICRRRTAAK
jgi:hypothetical protein